MLRGFGVVVVVAVGSGKVGKVVVRWLMRDDGYRALIFEHSICAEQCVGRQQQVAAK